MSIDRLSGSRDSRSDPSRPEPGGKVEKEGGNRQSATSGRNTNFQSAPPESNVNPPGRPQSSHGSATEPLAGGTKGAIEAGQSRQADTGGAAGGGNAGSSMGNADTADRGQSRRES